MKKNKKCIKIIILIILIILMGIVGYTYFSYKLNPIEVIEISMLQEEFEIESNLIMVVLPNEKIEESDEQESEKQNPNSSSSSSSGKTSSGNKYSSNGAGAKVTQATYTPKIQIPRTRINLTVYSEMSVRNMEKGVVILSTDNGLNQAGNTVISGHNYVNGRLFSNNDKIQVGDLIYITDSSGQKITYSVYNKYLTNPNDANYMIRDTGGAKEISLTTCTADSSQRLIILAREI